MLYINQNIMFKKLLLSLIVFLTISTINAQNCSDVNISIVMDNFPQEASWEIIDDQGNLIETNGEMVAGLNTSLLCLPDGCYSMLLFDNFGDGWNFGDSELNGSVLIGTPSGSFVYSFVDGNEASIGFGVNADGCEAMLPGCTDDTALNYNQNATEDDGSCEYACSDGQIPATLYVCTFGNGNEVAIEILDEDGNIVYENNGFSNMEIMNTELCLEEGMCYTVNMYNTVNTGWYGGYYWVNVNGIQVSTGFPADDENFATAEFSTNGPCGDVVLGCLDTEACNYDSSANWSDDSCTYPGCVDSTALNYDSSAGCDDGSCEYPEPCDDTQISISITMDSFSQEGSWEILNGDEVVASNYEMESGETTTFACLTDGCYAMIMYDAFGDGWAFGSSIENAGSVVITTPSGTFEYNFNNGGFATFGFGVNADDCEIAIPGCTDSIALNYNPNATEDDGTCNYPCADGTTPATLYVCTFGNGNEVAIEILDDDGNVVYENDGFTDMEVMNTELCLEEGMCYTVNMYNTVNTGWYGGYYWINVNGVQVSTGFPADDENFAAADFSTNGPCGDAVFGCTDEEACNYDSLANWNDQSCTYPGCTDSLAYNFNPSAGCEDDSCFYLDPVENDDCADAVAINCGETVSGLTIGATIDDLDGCGVSITAPGVWYTVTGEGWLINLSTCGQADFDTKLSVYSGDCDSLVCVAGLDDTPGCIGFTTSINFYGEVGVTYYVLVHAFSSGVGTFDLTVNCYDDEIFGCTDSLALNYNPMATVNDGSCIYQEDGCEALFSIFEINENEAMVVIINLSTGDALEYLWDFGDGNTSTEAFPIHYYESDGTYNVCLTITNTEDQCSDTICMDITYEGQGYIIDGQESVFTGAQSGFSINVISPQTISVDENILSNENISLFPNPVSTELTIQYNQMGADHLTYQIIDMTGRMILNSTNELINATTKIDVSSLSNGIYILTITNETGIAAQRFEVSK